MFGGVGEDVFDAEPAVSEAFLFGGGAICLRVIGDGLFGYSETGVGGFCEHVGGEFNAGDFWLQLFVGLACEDPESAL